MRYNGRSPADVSPGKMCLEVTVLDVKATVMSVPRDGRDLENCLLHTPHLKESPSRNAVGVTPSLEMLLSSLLMLPKVTAASRLSNEVHTAGQVLCCCFCGIIVPWCLSCTCRSHQSPPIWWSTSIFLPLPVASSPDDNTYSCVGVFWSPSKHADLQHILMLVRVFYFFKVGSCSCELYLLNFFFCSGKIRSIKSYG